MIKQLTPGGTLTETGGGTPAGGGGGVTDGDKGDITASAGGTVWTIDDGAVTYAKMQDVSATDMLLGRSTAGAGDVEEIPCTAAGRALLDDASALAQRTTLGVGTGDSPAFTQVRSNTAGNTGGFFFSANASIPSALVVETGTAAADVLSFGINVPQVGTRDNARVGGIVRLDSRAAEQRFVIFGYATGGSTPAERFSVNLQTGAVASAGDITVPDEAYDATAWNGSLEVPTKNAVRDKIEALPSATRGLLVWMGM